MRLNLLLSFLALSTTLACSQAATSLQPAMVNALGQDLYARSGSTGLVLVVVKDKDVQRMGFGETAPGSGRAPDADSLLRLCSLTKIFASDLLVKLIQECEAGGKGKCLSLNTTLQSTLAVRVPVLEPGRAMTLGDLATHTAGLPRELGQTPRGSGHFTYPSQSQRWNALPTLRLKAPAGAEASYSNLGFDLLGDALERETGMAYPQLLNAHTLVPLVMQETTFTPTPAQCARLLQGAHPEGQCTSTVNTAGSSGLYSTATDMARWLEYLLGTSTPQIPAQNSAAQAAYLFPANLARVQGLDHAGDPSGIGLGWIHTPGTNGAEIIEKTGGGAGFLTYIAMLPAEHLAIFVAATDGAVETHINLFRNANNVLLTLAGLPTIYIPPPRLPTPATHLAGKRVKARRKS